MANKYFIKLNLEYNPETENREDRESDWMLTSRTTTLAMLSADTEDGVDEHGECEAVYQWAKKAKVGDCLVTQDDTKMWLCVGPRFSFSTLTKVRVKTRFEVVPSEDQSALEDGYYEETEDESDESADEAEREFKSLRHKRKNPPNKRKKR